MRLRELWGGQLLQKQPGEAGAKFIDATLAD